MQNILILCGLLSFLLLIYYLGKEYSLNSFEGFDTKNKPLLKGCKPPRNQSGNCSGQIYITKGIDDAKPEVWTVCPYACPKGSQSDDISICKYDSQCASLDAKSGKFNHACIIKLHVDLTKISMNQVEKYSSKTEMEKALGYKICGDASPKHASPKHASPVYDQSQDMSDMIINPEDHGQFAQHAVPGGGAGPHGEQLPIPGRDGPGYPDGHGGGYNPECYPSPPKHYTPTHPTMNNIDHTTTNKPHKLPHSPHAPFESDGFVPPHHHPGSTNKTDTLVGASSIKCEINVK